MRNGYTKYVAGKVGWPVNWWFGGLRNDREKNLEQAISKIFEYVCHLIQKLVILNKLSLSS